MARKYGEKDTKSECLELADRFIVLYEFNKGLHLLASQLSLPLEDPLAVVLGEEAGAERVVEELPGGVDVPDGAFVKGDEEVPGVVANFLVFLDLVADEVGFARWKKRPKAVFFLKFVEEVSGDEGEMAADSHASFCEGVQGNHGEEMAVDCLGKIFEGAPLIVGPVVEKLVEGLFGVDLGREDLVLDEVRGCP